jgi:hypothetical protein
VKDFKAVQTGKKRSKSWISDITGAETHKIKKEQRILDGNNSQERITFKNQRWATKRNSKGNCQEPHGLGDQDANQTSL